MVSLIPVIMLLVLPEPFLKPSLCSRTVFWFSTLSHVFIWCLVSQRCVLSAQICSGVFPEKTITFIYDRCVSHGVFCHVLQFLFVLATLVLTRLLHTASDTFLAIPWFFGLFCPLGLFRALIGETVKVTLSCWPWTVNNLYCNRWCF